MDLVVQKFIDNCLAHAEYGYDKSVGQWAGWVETLPGVYAQGDTVEFVRQELAEMAEEHLLLNLREKRNIKGFDFRFSLAHA